MIFQGMPVISKAIAGERSKNIMAIGWTGTAYTSVIGEIISIEIVHRSSSKINSYSGRLKCAIRLLRPWEKGQ
jgi:hypothetical protein